VNSHADKQFRKQKRVGYFINVGVVVRWDDEREITVKGNNGDGWSSDNVVLRLGWRQNRDVVEW
jgi:hypothetical protein